MRTLLNETTDQEMRQMATEEQNDIVSSIKECEQNLIKELTPQDDADKASAILEIRAGK